MTDRPAPPGGMLLVTVDRLPAWMLPAYGCTWLAMPALTDLAGRGLLLDRVIAGGDDPLETLAALAGGGHWPLLAAAVAAGWSPAVVTDDEHLAARLPTGITVRHVPGTPGPDAAADEGETTLGRLFAVAADLAAERPHRFLWCHAASLGMAWDAPPEFRDAYLDPDDPPPPPGATVPELVVDDTTDPDLVVALRHVFAGQLTLLDDCLGRLVDTVASRSSERPWTVLVAGVRGIGLGLHSRVGCGPLAPFGELAHLPAILVDHGGRMAAQRYGGIVVPADLGATLLDLAGAAPATSDDPRTGRSLTGLFDSWRHAGRDRAICVASHGTAIATGAWHLVLPAAAGEDDRPARLYAKPDDYFEACDVADRCPEVAAELTAIARQALGDAAAAWACPLSEAARQGV
ncbi:MAG: hypothetical protein ACKOCX_07685 [Planctomycetota bacterium]